MDSFHCSSAKTFLSKTFSRYMFNSVRSFNFSIITFQQSQGDMLLLLSISLANIKTMGLSADWLDMPGSLILLLVVAPSFFAHTLKDSWVGVVICLLIGCYLLQEHIRASGGFRNSFTQGHGISNTLGIVLLLVYPVWALVLHLIQFLQFQYLGLQNCVCLCNQLEHEQKHSYFYQEYVYALEF